MEAGGLQLSVFAGDCRGKTGTSGASVTGEPSPRLAPGIGMPSAPPRRAPHVVMGVEEGRPPKERVPVKTYVPQETGERTDELRREPRLGVALSFGQGADGASELSVPVSPPARRGGYHATLLVMLLAFGGHE